MSRLLARLVHDVLRRDARLRDWFKRVKRRRGPTVARVPVMRKLATVIRRILGKGTTYAECRELAAA
jgi:transposase